MQGHSTPRPSPITVHRSRCERIDARDTWLIENDVACNNANLNGDGNVDTLDMAIFNDLFSLGARRVDMNTDGRTDATNAILYQDAYDAATGP